MKYTAASCLLAMALSSVSWTAHATSPAQWQAMASTASVTLEHAAEQAVQLVPGKVAEIELDNDGDKGVRYEAQVITPAGDSVEVWVDAISGQARIHKNDGPAKIKDIDRTNGAQISLTHAVRSALKHTIGTPVQAELDTHWGVLMYKVDVLQSEHTLTQVKVDAGDGQIIGIKME